MKNKYNNVINLVPVVSIEDTRNTEVETDEIIRSHGNFLPNT